MSQIYSPDASGLTTFSVVFQDLSIGKKSPWVKRLNLHRATLPLFLFALRLPLPADALKAMWV
jgi:hypothetical protein